jgi:aryl-alcohol dehydrogenase-like predicted oxidoreductase
MQSLELRTRPLGTTGMDISTVGFGAWAISGNGWSYGWGPQDDAESIAAVRHAVASGVNWIDTAAVYGLGHSEEIVGAAIADIPEPDRPLVFTKVGLVWDEADPSAPPRKVMRPDSVRREVEASLRRLGVDRIDLYQVHWPGDGALIGYGGHDAGEVDGHDLATPLEEYWQVMADLRAEGKVRAIGLSNHDVGQLATAERIAHVDAIQPHFSALDRAAAPELAWSAAHGTGVIAYSPMESGLLTGTWSAARVAALPEDDWRKGSSGFTTDLARNLALVDALRPVADRHDVPLAAVAVAWVLGWPGVTGAIVGARRPEQVDGWLPAAALELDEADHDEIAQAIARTGAGQGPARR